MPHDARTEARRRIAEAIEDAPWPCPHGGINSMDSADWFTCPECRADAVLALFEPDEQWRVEGSEWVPDEYEGGDWMTWVRNASDRDDAISLAKKYGGKPIVTLTLSLPVEPVTEEPTDAH